MVRLHSITNDDDGSVEMPEPIELTREEIQKIACVQEQVNRRYVGKPEDIKILSQLCDELRTRCHDVGIVVDVHPELTPGNNWVPVCEVVGRVDAVELDPERMAADIKAGNVEIARTESADPSVFELEHVTFVK